MAHTDLKWFESILPRAIRASEAAGILTASPASIAVGACLYAVDAAKWASRPNASRWDGVEAESARLAARRALAAAGLT